MGGGAADEGQICAVEPILEHLRQEMASLPIPDELMAEILLRLPTTADLARASAAGVSFRRVATDRPFLRRYRKLHAAPLLGFLDRETQVFHPAVPPHPSAPGASAAALAADFSFTFLPAPAGDWLVRDIRDGRLLLVFPELVVCDPLHRRHLLLPPIPAHLAATVEDPLWRTRHRYCETFLAPRWRRRGGGIGLTIFSCRQYAYGCLYWVSEEWLLVLDTQKMEFSIAEPPPEAKGLHMFIVEAGQGRIGMFVRPIYANYVNYTMRRNNCGSSSQWQFEKTVSLDSRYFLIGSAGRHLFLYQCESLSIDPGCFLLDVKTFQIERVFVSKPCTPVLHAYSNFPPSLLSTPTVSSDCSYVPLPIKRSPKNGEVSA
ncbi:unnamed protein product [Alopecurus aequalis]